MIIETNYNIKNKELKNNIIKFISKMKNQIF